ncbi:copper resistance CopC family protein [Halobacillus campisalis]|uniref:Copper resistance protein CopC n=1 Tax=Halobacillus campisalis TaxID=435909 RepID=A0ABW2K6W7_9BACI|nr:copper resistance CopC family protein [Halobacillus campisalis]
MKKAVVMLIMLVLIFPTLAGAHTHLESADPEAGETISEVNSTITLTFDSPVQEPNEINVTNGSGEEMEITEINHSPENVIEVTLPSSMENGDFTLFYSIVGEDGHIMEDELEYKYEGLEDVEENEEAAEEAAEEEAEKEAENEAGNASDESATESDEQVESSEDQSGNEGGWTLPLIVALLAAVAVIAFMFIRKKS